MRPPALVAEKKKPEMACTLRISLGDWALSAVGEGAVVGAGALAGGSGSDGIAFVTFVGPVGWAMVGYSKKDNYDSDCA
ncbi:hypothetical protein ACHAPM_007387 [Fusarium culmorum]